MNTNDNRKSVNDNHNSINYNCTFVVKLQSPKTMGKFKSKIKSENHMSSEIIITNKITVITNHNSKSQSPHHSHPNHHLK